MYEMLTGTAITSPDAVVSTGAGVAVPFLLIARLLRVRAVYVESFARQTNLSLSGRMLYPLLRDFFVQSERLAQQYERARFLGTIY